jgi:hypothetical protein
VKKPVQSDTPGGFSLRLAPAVAATPLVRQINKILFDPKIDLVLQYRTFFQAFSSLFFAFFTSKVEWYFRGLIRTIPLTISIFFKKPVLCGYHAFFEFPLIHEIRTDTIICHHCFCTGRVRQVRNYRMSPVPFSLITLITEWRGASVSSLFIKN